MSHEIRTPINAVIGFTNLLQKLHSPRIRNNLCAWYSRPVESLLTIINDILDISKIEAGMLRMEKALQSPRTL